jgi:hypothetical protein
MMALDMTKSTALSVFLVLGAATPSRPALAEPGCSLSGEPVMANGVAIYDAPSGGTELAHFTGAKVGLTVSSFPEAAGGRARVETTGFRIQGFLRARDVPAYTAHSVPVYAGHVWIADGRRVTVIGAGPGKLHVEKALVTPISGYFHGWAPCDAFTLSPRVPAGFSPDGDARAYVLKKDRLDLYSEANGSVVTSIERAADGPGVLFFGGDRSGGWVHVEYHGDVILDGWIRAGDTTALPPGETMDQLAPSVREPGSPRLSLAGTTKVVRVASPAAIRAAASDAAAVIGGVDPGVDVYVLDVVAGWASVLPKALGLAAGSGQFWVRARDLGL